MPTEWGGRPPTDRIPIFGKRLWASRVWDKLGYRPHMGQAAVHASETRNKVIAGGRRLGKSEIGAAELMAEAVLTRYFLRHLEESGRRREFWIVGPEYSDSEKEFRKLYDALKSAGAPFDKPGTYYNAHNMDMQLSMYNGKFLVMAKSSRYPERLVGEGLAGVVMAEAAKLKPSTWFKYIRPTLADYQGWSVFSSTPEGKNWFYELWQAGQDPSNPDWESWRLPSWFNPYVYPRSNGKDLMRPPKQGWKAPKKPVVHNPTERDIATLRAALEEGGFDWRELVAKLGMNPEIASMVRDLGEVEFNQEVAADFSEFIGRVFGDFDEEIHVGDFKLDPNRPCWAAVDYGFTNPFVWLVVQEDVWGNIYVLDELYESGLTTDDAVEVLQGRGLVPANMAAFYADPAEPGDTLTLESKLRVKGVAGGATGGPISDRLRLIRQYLKVKNEHRPWGDPTRRPRLMFDRRCKHTIYEFGQYRYPDGGGENPRKEDDHTPEALGRFFKGHFGTHEPEVSATTIRRGRTVRR